jgi:hypothetical protein
MDPSGNWTSSVPTRSCLSSRNTARPAAGAVSGNAVGKAVEVVMALAAGQIGING